MTFGLSAGAIASIAAPVVGGLLGSQGSSQSSSQQRDLPEFLKPFILGQNGQGGLLNDVQNTYRQQMANGGLHPYQQAGIEMQRQFLMSPQYTQGYDQMRNNGMNLMGRGVAANPFSTGGGVGFAGLNRTAQGQAQPPQLPAGAPALGNFQYQMNPALQGGMGAMGGQAAPQSPQQPAAPSMDEILAELARRQQQQSAIVDYTGSGAGGAGSGY